MKTVVQGWVKGYHTERSMRCDASAHEMSCIVDFEWHGGGCTLRLTQAQFAAINPYCDHCGHFDEKARVTFTIEKAAK